MGTDDATSAVKHCSDDDQSLPVAEDTNEGIASGLKNYLRVFTYNDRLGWSLNAVSILCMIASGAALPLMNIVFGKFINIFNDFVSGDLSAEAYKREIGKFSLYFVYLFVAKLILVYIWSVLFSVTAIRTVKNLRVDFLRQTLHQEISFFDNLSTSIAGQIATSGNMVHNGISEKLGITIQATSTFVAAFIVAFISQWKLTLILCCIPPLNVAVTLIGFRYVEKYDAQMYEFFGKADALAEEALSTIRAVHAFWAFPKLSSRYRDIVWNAKKNGGDQQTPLFMVIYPVQFFGILAGYGLAFWRGINMYSSGEVTEPGTVVTVILATIVAAQSLTQITPQIVVIGKAAAAARELFAIIDRKSAIYPYSTSGSKVTEFSGAIELKNVNFSYPSRPDVPVLRNVSLNVPANKTIALVGASGSGKSTIIGLLERWYSLEDGKITLDGHDLNRIDLEWLRTNMRLVQQEPTLFSGTIYQNVADGFTGTILDSLPEEEKHILVREACQATFAHEFITALPQAYDTWLNERGGSLSGGQKQRLVIARAIVSNPKVLLLDEATSALDPQAEKIVQKAINNIAVNRTILVIAHRLSTIRNAHSIVVMSKGEVVEQGTHSELVAAKGTYAKLVEAQNLGEGDEDEVNAFNKGMQKSDQPGSATTSHASGDAVVAMPARVSHGLFKGIYLIVREQKKLWLPTLCTIIQGIIGGATYPTLAVFFAWSLEAFQTPDVGKGNFYALMFFVVALVNGLGYIVAGGYSNYMAQRIMCYYRADAFSSTLRQDMSYFDHPENSTGTLTSRIASEPYNIVEIVAYNFLYIIINIVNVVASAILAIAYGWKLGLVLALGGLPILMAAGYARIRLEFKFEEEAAERFAQSSGIATESVLAIRTVSSLALEKTITRRYELSLQRIENDAIRGLGWKMLFYALSQSASFLVMGLGFWYGGQLVLTGEYSTLQFYTIFAAIVFSGEAVAYFFQFTISFSKGRSSINYILSLRESQVLLETDAAKEDPDGHESCADKSGQQSEQGKAIFFGGVDFAYPLRQDTKVLHDINIEVVPGTMVAFVGASGCGKSTMIALMERFYDPIRGSIIADNLDLKDQSRFHYRKDVALVQQEPVLYQGSIRENIALGIEEGQPSDQEVIDACKEANIWEFVSSLPEGLATLCGSQGYSLSGGQRQRIAIARALIRKPRLLLLDEATSALDTESEKVVKAALDKAASGRTTIAVAHRLSTVRDADLIIVFDKGAVVERGTHDQLLAQKGVYFAMVKGQSLDKEVLQH